jgi:predicted dehydrogenase
MHPQTEKLKDLIKSGVIGDLRIINATFSFKSDANEIDRKKIKALGGGGILDVGCYPISMINLIACQALEKYQIEPEEIVGLSLLDKEGVDDLSVCSLKFSEGILALVSCGISLAQENGIKIFGSEGSLSISSPWIPGGRNPGITKIVLQKNNSQEPELFFVKTNVGSSNFMIDHFVKSITDIGSWGLYANESLANMKTLDRWRASAGVAYQSDN